MHELGIAQTIVDTVLSEVEKSDAKKVTQISVDVGQLMQLDRNALAFALRVLMNGPVLQGARITVRVKRASFACRKCSQVWGMAEAQKQLAKIPGTLRVREPDSRELPLHFLPFLYPAFLSCPKCGSADISSKEGEEMRLRKVVIE